ncbi:MAG TPA: hypothetical protein VFN22_12325 [Gemmatimonadales bacterium]|nr:hypothetical protein [Gemmatimonadales bacterium]
MPMRSWPFIPLLLICLVGPLRAQSSHAVTLFAEPIAGGVEYLRSVGGAWHLGAGVGVGPSEGLNLGAAPSFDADPWATGYLTLAVRSARGMELALSPAGLIAIVASDFGVIYPSAQVQLSVGAGRFRLGTIVRTIRLAGPNGGSDWWTQWLPLRVGIRL